MFLNIFDVFEHFGDFGPGTTAVGGVVGVGVYLYIWPLGPENPVSGPFLPSYGWGLDYPKSLSLFWEKSL